LQRAGAKVGILDADVYGPNVPLMLGATGRPGEIAVGTDKRIAPLRAHGLAVMSIGFMIAEDQPVIWRGPMLHSAMKSFLFEVHWGDLDYLIVDLPPGTGDAQLSLAQQAHVTGAVVVTTPQDVSVLDVRKAIRMFQTVQVPVLGVVENMAYFTPPGSTERFEIFGRGGGAKIEVEFRVPLLGQIPIDLAVREGGDRGTPVVVSHPASSAAQALTDIAGRIAARISTLNAT
jgi:ATP-binding protein involved in chromosome partitioning